MGEPDRLSDAAGAQGALLRVVQELRVSEATRARLSRRAPIYAALGVISSKAGAVGSLLASKTVMTVGGVAAIAIAGVWALQEDSAALPPETAPPTAISALPTRAPRSEPLPAATEQPSVAEPPPPAAPAEAPKARAHGPVPIIDSLQAELEMLRRARGQLASGEASAALAITDDHARRFRNAKLAQEMEVVRIESLAALGRSGEAEQRANRFLKRYPDSMLAARVRRLTNGGSKP
jgi:hypothetical protein